MESNLKNLKIWKKDWIFASFWMIMIILIVRYFVSSFNSYNELYSRQQSLFYPQRAIMINLVHDDRFMHSNSTLFSIYIRVG